MTYNVERPGHSFPEESELENAFGDLSDPVPLLQVMSHTEKDAEECVVGFLKRMHVPYGVLECSAFMESSGQYPAPLVNWAWNEFIQEIISGIGHAFPRDYVRIGKQRGSEVRNCMDLIRLINNLTTSEYDFNPTGKLKCIAVVLKSYHDLLGSEANLLHTFIRIHEKLSNIQTEPNLYRKKVVVILLGPYPVPKEVIGNNLTIPVIYMDPLPQKERGEQIKFRNRVFAVEKGQELLKNVTEHTFNQLWDAFVDYVMDVLYTWFPTDPDTLEFHCRILWPWFLEPIKKCGAEALKDLEAITPHLCRSLDTHLRYVTYNYQSRFLAELMDMNATEGDFGCKQLYKFHGSRLAKYLLIGAAMATFCDVARVRSCLRKRRRTPPTKQINFWSQRRYFDINAWMANADWVIQSNESESPIHDHVFWDQITWIIEEGYVKPYSHIDAWKLLPTSRSTRLWSVSDTTTHGELNCRHLQYQKCNNNNDLGSYLSQMLKNSSRFLLCAPKELIISVAKDLDISLAEFIIR